MHWMMTAGFVCTSPWGLNCEARNEDYRHQSDCNFFAVGPVGAWALHGPKYPSGQPLGAGVGARLTTRQLQWPTGRGMAR